MLEMGFCGVGCDVVCLIERYTVVCFACHVSDTSLSLLHHRIPNYVASRAVTFEQWDAIPAIGDYTVKRARKEIVRGVPDSVIEAKMAQNITLATAARVCVRVCVGVWEGHMGRAGTYGGWWVRKEA